MFLFWDAGCGEAGHLTATAPLEATAVGADAARGYPFLAKRGWADFIRCCCVCLAATVDFFADGNSLVGHGLWVTDGVFVINAPMHG